MRQEERPYDEAGLRLARSKRQKLRKAKKGQKEEIQIQIRWKNTDENTAKNNIHICTKNIHTNINIVNNIFSSKITSIFKIFFPYKMSSIFYNFFQAKSPQY